MKEVSKTNPVKIAVLSGRRMDQGKTSVVDNLIAPRVDNLVRIEIEAASTGSAKAGVQRIPAKKLPQLLDALDSLDANQSLVCDVGGSEYASFMHEVGKFKSTTDDFDLFVFVMRQEGIKQSDALESIIELIQMGADPEKIRVVFNFAPYDNSTSVVRDNLKIAFPNVFEAAKSAGFKVCETPIIEAIDLYKLVLGHPEITIDGLAAAPSYRDKIRAMTRAGEQVSDEMRFMRLAQDSAISYVKPNLDDVWAEVMA